MLKVTPLRLAEYCLRLVEDDRLEHGSRSPTRERQRDLLPLPFENLSAEDFPRSCSRILKILERRAGREALLLLLICCKNVHFSLEVRPDDQTMLDRATNRADVQLQDSSRVKLRDNEVKCEWPQSRVSAVSGREKRLLSRFLYNPSILRVLGFNKKKTSLW